MTAPLVGAMASGRWGSPAGFVRNRYVLNFENVRACRAFWIAQVYDRREDTGGALEVAAGHVAHCDALLRWLSLGAGEGPAARAGAQRARAGLVVVQGGH